MKKLILDSSLSANGNLSQPLWRFSTGIRIHGIRLNTAILPLSFYNVKSQNNVIAFGDGNSERTATLNPGLYSAEQLADEVARAMSAGGTQSYTVTHNPLTNRLTVTAPGTFRFI